jgi:hypothetical protein
MYYHSYMVKRERTVATFQIEPEQLDTLNLLREQLGIPHSDTIRRALDAWFEQPSVQVLLQQAMQRQKAKTDTRKFGKKRMR